MDTTNLIIYHGAQRQPVKTRVDTFPHHRPQLVAEPMLALPEKRSIPVVLLPAIDLRRVDGVISRRRRRDTLSTSSTRRWRTGRTKLSQAPKIDDEGRAAYERTPPQDVARLVVAPQ